MADNDPKPRCVVLVLNNDLRSSAEPSALFDKLRRYGTFFPSAADAHGGETLREWMTMRARAMPEPYGHWYLSGAISDQMDPAAIVSLSYDGLRPTRIRILTLFNRARQDTSGGPDGLREALLHVTPQEMGLDSMSDTVLRNFVLDLFTNGSGTQLYATTFIQWSVREILRRAQPRTVVARFSPRCKAASMDERFSHPEVEPAPDYAGSLVDAEMGAYMSYLNLQRLAGSRSSSFLAWHEGYGQAVLIGPGMPEGTISASPVNMHQLLSLVTQVNPLP